ncbi:hypothetical protein A5853_002524, partial [Enterococcus faecium]
ETIELSLQEGDIIIRDSYSYYGFKYVKYTKCLKKIPVIRVEG